MQHFGAQEGTGRLISGGEERGDVRCRIEVSKDDARNIAEALVALEASPRRAPV